jgi:hypothetical protein
MRAQLLEVLGDHGAADALASPDVVEIPLLIPGWQMDALETAAHARGQTAGEMVRNLLRDFISGLPTARPSDRLRTSRLDAR